MKRIVLIATTALVLAACTGSRERPVVEYGGVRFVPLQTERLPDMPRPRSGHVALPFGNGFVAAGGHTSGFIPVQEADFWNSGKWTTVPMLYPHDNSFGLILGDGSLVLGGGYSEAFGIGQTWGVERYDLSEKRFSPLPILQQKRAKASALELGGGRLIVSGNWWEKDVTEDYTNEGKIPVSQDRAHPYILRSDIDNAIIFGSLSSYAQPLGGTVDRLYGEPFNVPLLEKWHPILQDNESPRADDCFIGDFSTGHFTYLVHAKDSTRHHSVLLKVAGERFSLLDTDKPIPTEGPWGPIGYSSYAHVDRSSRTAWIVGTDEHSRVYMAGVSYEETPAPVTVWYTDSLEAVARYPADLLLPDGRLVLTGGSDPLNYEPSASVYMLSPGGVPAGSGTSRLLAIVGLVLLGGISLWLLRRKQSADAAQTEPSAPPSMASRIDSLMRDRQFFRRPNLRVADVARELGTNNTYVSACINGETGLSFPDYVAGFRICYAQELLRNYPDKLLSEVASESGFVSEKSFFRTFKDVTGVTPGEWKKSH